MISNLRDTKYYFENLFDTWWEQTPIHFVGQDFDQDNTQRWINPFYTPTFSASKGLGSLTTNYGNLMVACWAENDVQAMELGDTLIAFITDNVGTAYRIKNYEVSDHGWHKTNKVYVTITFNLEILEGVC